MAVFYFYIGFLLLIGKGITQKETHLGQDQDAPEPPARGTTSTTEPTYTDIVFTTARRRAINTTAYNSCELCNIGCDSLSTCTRCDCAESVKRQRLAIINSNAWMVSIQQRLPGSNEHVHICSGSLISERLVLTAPSCIFEGQTVFKKRSRRKLSVVVGSDGMNAFRVPVLDMDISSSAANLKPYVTHNILQNDVAIIVLWESINKIPEKFVKRVAFIDLPSNQTDFFPSCRFYLCFLPLWTWPPNESESSSDWGTSVHTASVVPYVASLAILTNYSACQALWGNGTIIGSQMLCTNGTIDTCEGNFGGPLVETFYDYEANMLKGRIIGINIIQNKMTCAPDTVVVSAFVRINLFTPWINWIMRRF